MIKSEKVVTIREDANGNITTDTTEKTSNVQHNEEPDYIKLYTRMWCEFNGIPLAYRGLFLELVTRMTYCNSARLESSQLVNTGKPWSDDIMSALDWKKTMYQKGLAALCECGAIRKVGRGVYQISPHYAGKGEWKYNPKYDRGGVEDLVAVFDFRDKTVKTSITWASDGSDSDLGLKHGETLTAKRTTIRPQADIGDYDVPGQMTINDFPEALGGSVNG